MTSLLKCFKDCVLHHNSSTRTILTLVQHLTRSILTHIPEKDKELGVAQKNIKALSATEVLKDKAIEQVSNSRQYK